ncbi:cardiac-enriched FHL2-interacting protein [Clarias magur]|uniref:Cardiac-enriched FHL2-interacting protein n=1 Tax=Clarias magur TaxID=1594786 RepID=A0A8J4XHY4_CLAMG|nr:cardiac-enriched FHL2-interacting protein [Clarias magur]
MSSLEKRQANRRGSTHGPRKCSDGISDTSSAGSFMDDTDREVSSLTERAFRSLCIGEDAIYNDLEVSSPADQHKTCAQEALQKKDLTISCQEFSSHGIQYEGVERKSEVASTFQHSYVDVAQEHVLRDESLSYISNGSMEVTWQQKRSTSRVSSLIKAFSSGESYCDSEAPDTVKDKYRDFNNKSWDRSALLSIQKELSGSGYCSDFKSGPLQSYGNHFHSVAQVNTSTSSKTKFKALNTTNLFFHSEFSPFQLWRDYNRFPFERGEPSGFVPVTEFPRWYESPLYKEITAMHRISSSPAEGRQFTRRQIEDISATQRSKSTVIQKASAVEKRSESEIASNNPPWKNNNFARNKLPSNRPSTASPTNEKMYRPDSSLLYQSRHTYETHHKVGKAGSSELPSRTTPFNISQLLTPVIPGRQDTETSEILQFAHTPLISECDGDLKPQSDAKQLRDSYKSKASSLLFNLKDNRKRVKSTYSPTKFKGLELSDRSKQPSKMEGRESRLSESSSLKVANQELSTAPDAWELSNSNYELSLSQTAEHQQYVDKAHNNMPLFSKYGTTNCNIPYLGSQDNHPGRLNNREREHFELKTNSGHGNNGRSPVREDAHYQNFKEGRNFVRKPNSGYINNQVTEENLPWKRAGPVNMVTKEMGNNNGIKDALPYKGEIAALIEMDKQRKATAKQYLPSANESSTMRKEMSINKVNENINGSWLPQDKQVQDTKSSLQTYTNKCLQKMVPPPKEANFTFGSELTTHEKAEVRLEGNMKYAANDIETEKDYSQRTQFLQSTEEKYQYNEGSVAYQPYKYESNKQWHIVTTEDRHTKGDECMSRQLPETETKAEHPNASNYVHSLSRISGIQQQSTAYPARTSQRNLIIVERAKTEEHKPTYSIAPSQTYHVEGDINTHLHIPNTQRTFQNTNRSQTRGEKFNINDILSVRDNEQVKKSRENRHSFNGRVGDPNKLENLTSPVTFDVAENIAAKSEPSKVLSQAQQDGNSHCNHENTNVSYGFPRKQSHVSNEVKEKSGKDMLISNEKDKITPRALSYKEKGQTKQEILTSKLKAHAQKEISAIKGLAKHSIPSRNPIKQSLSVSNESGQINQEVLSPKREITAEKLNHLFQDITYSSVPLYKEQKNQDTNEPKSESLKAEKVELPTRNMGIEKDKVANEDERSKMQMIKSQDERFTEAGKKNFVQNYAHQLNMKSKENQLSNPSEDNEKETETTNGNILDKSFSSSPSLKVFTDKESSVSKKNSSLPNLSTTYTSNNTDHSTFKVNNNYIPNHEVLVKAATNQLTLCSISGEAVTLERSVNKLKEQLLNVNTDKSTADNNAPSQQCHDFNERSKFKDNTIKENQLMLPHARQFEIGTGQDKTSSDWMNDENQPASEVTVEFIDSKTMLPNKEMANTDQQREQFEPGAGGVSKNPTVFSENPTNANNQICTESPGKEKQEIQTTNEDVFLHKPQNTHDDVLKSLENAHAIKTLGYQTTLGLNKAVSMELDSSEGNKYYLEQEQKGKMLHCENNEVKETVSQFQLKIEDENQNRPMTKDQEVTESNNQQLEADNETSASDAEQHKQNAKDFHEHTEITAMETKQSNDGIRTCDSDSKSSGTEHEKSDEELFKPIVTTNNKDEQLSGPPAPDKSADIKNSVSESHIIHIASKADSSPTDEPVIYNICVSSTSETVSEDEPIIFSISVSSLCDAAVITSPENQEKSQNQLSREHTEKGEKETINKNKEHDFVENKEDSKEVKLLLNNHMAEQETVERKNDSPASKDKLDYYRSTEVDDISSSYESLLAKNGLPNGDTIPLESDPKEQDKKRADEKDERTGKALQKIQNNTMDNDHPSPEKMLTLAEFTKKHSPECRKSKSPETPPELLRNDEENHMQHVPVSEQEHQIADRGGTQRAEGVLYSDKNIEKHVSEKQEILMSKIAPVCGDTEDTQPTRKIMANGNVQLEENKQVGQKGQTVEKRLKESDDDDVVNKNPEVVQVPSENDTQLPAGFSSANSSNKSLNHSCDESPRPSAKISTNGCQIKIKTQDTGGSSVQTSQNAVHQTDNTKSPTLQHRTQGVCARDALNQEKVSKEHLQSRNNKDLQNNRNELVCKSEFPDMEKVRFMTSNEVKISRVSVSQKEISNITNEQTKENVTVNQTQIKYDLSAGKTDQSVFTVPDITLQDEEVHKNDRKYQIKAESTSTRYAVPPNNISESPQNTTPAKVTGTKASSALVTTGDDLERTENEKWKSEPAQKAKGIRKEIIPLNKDFKIASSVIKADKDVKCSKNDTNQKEVKAQPQYKIDGHVEKAITEKRSGLKEIKSGIGTLRESNDVTKYDIESRGKVLEDERYQINSVYHPQKDGLLQKKENTCDGKSRLESNQSSNYHDTGLSKKEGTVIKTEATHREKKTTRPEISALADYARLRVISAEDDTITEKDLLQKMNMYQKYNLSAVEPQKANFSMSVGSTEQSKQLSVNNMTPENSNSTTAPLQVQERRTYKITEETLAEQYQCSPRGEIITYPKVGSLTKSSGDRGFIVNNPESTKEKTLNNPLNKNAKKSLTAQDYGYSRSHEVYQPQNPQATHPVQTQIEDKNDPKLKQPVNANMSQSKAYTQVKNSQSVTQVSIETEINNANRPADNHIKEDVKDEETAEELQYYIVNAMESEKKTKNSQEPLSLSQQNALKKELTEMHATSPRSNTSSPAMGKPILFRVKDNTGKTSSVTKTVRPRFHRSLSEEFKISSPVDSCSEKSKADYGQENDPKESPNSQFFQEQPVTSHQLPRANEIQVRSKILSPELIAPKEPESYDRRSHLTEQDESRSLVSTVSETVRGPAASSVVMTNSRGFHTEHIRQNYARPASSFYERPESACYDRPESACSDMKPSSKPPVVPPKTDKALRRAKRLTSRRVKKVEDDKEPSDTPVQPETMSQAVSSLPASPIIQMSTPPSVQASPVISHYHVEPNYAPPAPSLVAHSFPITQRRLLQDPNSGQIFMVDMPVQVKTKTFFDPETGKYLQLNVRQRAQSTLSQPASVEVLGHPYVMYPGFLPMPFPVPSLPSVRSSSQMSAPASLTDQPNQLKASHESNEQGISDPERHRNVVQHKRPAHRTQHVKTGPE